MNPQEITTRIQDPLDILRIIEVEETNIPAEDPLLLEGEILQQAESPFEECVSGGNISLKTKKSLLSRFRESVTQQAKFFLYYIATSSIVFFILMGTTNWNSYSTLLSAYINPNALKNSRDEIISVLNKSKIMVYANADDDVSKQEEEMGLKKKLEESNTTIREDLFSPKKLVLGEAKLDIGFDITPYDNVIIIPKIGKNIPLVDVKLDAGFDFDHIENIFMNELEKGVVRYPGTSKPGEEGNTFIFGHSSNYPWIKGEYNSVFALIDELSFGDEIIVYYNQKKFTYVIREKKVVKPGNVKVLERDPLRKELSLMTCWPIGTTLNRLIVIAELKE